jgi:hypothetical protein
MLQNPCPKIGGHFFDLNQNSHYKAGFKFLKQLEIKIEIPVPVSSCSTGTGTCVHSETKENKLFDHSRSLMSPDPASSSDIPDGFAK